MSRNGILLAVVLANFGISAPGHAALQIKKTRPYVPGEMVVKLKDQSSIQGTLKGQSVTVHLSSVLAAFQVEKVQVFRTDQRLHLVKIKQGNHTLQAVQALAQDPAVEYAEPNFLYHAMLENELPSGAPNDPKFTQLWGLYNFGQKDESGQEGMVGSDINVIPVWKEGIRGSRAIKVAVIDTGVDWNHPDLKANIWTNPGEAGELANNGKDDDGNGFIDDTHGWNFAVGNRDSSDDHNHGTHCAGTIGGSGNNGEGVTGVNWEVSIVPVKFLSASGGGTLAAAVEAINYARLVNVDIMSNSWGGGGYSEALKEAIVKAKDAGILFVAAAGNSRSDNDANATYPAGYDVENVVAVAATDNQDKLAQFSNWGSETVHVAAPGVKVVSTIRDGGYAAYSGTSMATPHVSGVAALLLSQDSTLGFATVKDRLISTSDRIKNLRRKVVAKGRVNAFHAMMNIPPENNDPDESKWIDVQKVIESPHPYESSKDYSFTVNYPGAAFIRVVFDKIDVEKGYDKIFVQEVQGEIVEEITGQKEGFTSDYIAGDTAVIRLQSDSSVTRWGFKVGKIQVIPAE